MEIHEQELYFSFINQYQIVGIIQLVYFIYSFLQFGWNKKKLGKLIQKHFDQQINQMNKSVSKNRYESREGVVVQGSSKDRNWSDLQLYKLSSFMLYHLDKFQTEQQRRESKIYAILSKYITTRNINQCRNYVRKLKNKFSNYHSIINFFKHSLPLFHQKFKEESIQLQKIIFPLKTISKEIKKLNKTNDQIEQKIQPEDELISQRECSVEQIIKDENLSIQKDLKPTDIDYYEAPQEQIYEQSKSDLIHMASKEKSSEQRSNFSQRKSSVLDQSYFQSHFQEEEQTEYQKHWKECHQMFFKWALKTTNLLQKYIVQPTYLQGCSN